MRFTTKNIETVLWCIAFAILVLWLCIPTWQHWEPILGITNLMAIALVRWVNWKLEKAEYSPALALALGYVNNYLEPVIMGLLQKHNNFLVYIYIPKDLVELDSNNIERVKGEIESKDFSVEKVKISEGKKGRMRSCLEIKSVTNGDSFYFDFPETLNSLEDYIDYKIGSKRNQFTKSNKVKLGKNLIQIFRENMILTLNEKGLNQYIKIVDKDLKFNH